MTADNIAVLLIGIIITFPIWLLLAYLIKNIKIGIENYIAKRVKVNTDNRTPASSISVMERDIQKLTDMSNGTYNMVRDVNAKVGRVSGYIEETLASIDDLEKENIDFAEDQESLNAKFIALEKKYDALREKVNLIISI